MRNNTIYCTICGNITTNENKVDTHNNYGYICPNCYQHGVISVDGIFAPRYFQERQAKKSAGHGCRMWWTIQTADNEINLRAYLESNYAVARVGHTLVSNAKVGTWQVSKVADYLEELGIDRNRLAVVVQKNGYEFNGDVDTAIELVRNVSAIGYLSKTAIAKYGMKKIAPKYGKYAK